MSEFAGSLREFVAIEELEDGRSAEGLHLGSWRTVHRCWAAIVPEGAGQEAEGMTLSYMPRYGVTIRATQSVEVAQRVRWKGKLLAVRQIVDDPRTPDRLMLRCEEVRP